MNLRQQYKTWTERQYNKYCDYQSWEFAPHFRWNPFDDRNDFSPEWLQDWVSGLRGVSYAWEAWSYLMRDKKYSYQLPDCFWAELNNWWCYERTKKNFPENGWTIKKLDH